MKKLRVNSYKGKLKSAHGQHKAKTQEEEREGACVTPTGSKLT